jgi:molybdopterin molybdotransferase
MVGARQLEVAPLPRVSFLVTGDEVVPIDAEIEPAQVRDTHGPFLTAALAGLGIRARSLGIVPDDPAALETALSAAFTDDVVIATGGVSAGEFDFVEPAVERLGGRWLFDGIAMQPGKPLVAAQTERGFFIGLPGNPASAMVGWWLIVRPLLQALAGAPVAPAWAAARQVELGGAAPGAHDRDRFLPATLTLVRGRSVATPIATRGSHDLPAYAQAQALIRIRAGDAARAAGATVEALELRELGED